jgi:hypothetical protein
MSFQFQDSLLYALEAPSTPSPKCRKPSFCSKQNKRQKLIEMTSPIAPRRSERLSAKNGTASTSITKRPSRKGRSPSSPRSTKTEHLNPWLRKASTSSASSIDLDLIDSNLAAKLQSANRKPNTKTPIEPSIADFIADSASSSDHSTNCEGSDEEDSDGKYGELADLSTDNFEWGAADNIDASRNQSYDSRYEPGNEDYEMDEFVVGDDEEIEEWSETEDDDEPRYIYKELVDITRHPSGNTVESRRSSSESKLFFSDPNDNPNPWALASWSELDFNCEGLEQGDEPLIAEASSDVVEEIVDATALFRGEVTCIHLYRNNRCNGKKR